tara:strand:+ start:438 stop:1226 length:789 start_codon:yes stop_codon:yes gene_type:complete
MPTADKFSTNGVYNGLSGCVPKVDVSGFDYWTTASGYNKDSVGAVTQEQIEQSLHKIGLLYWNMHRVTCATGNVSIPISMLTDVIVSGWDAPNEVTEPDPIQPSERVCSGSLTRGGDTLPNLADVDLRLASGFARFYKGEVTDEANFIGYGLGLIDWAGGVSSGSDLAPFAMWVIDFFVDPQSLLGGYSNDDIGSGNGRTYEYTYVERDGIHMLWLGAIVEDSTLDPSVVTQVKSETLRAWLEDGGVVQEQAQITGFEFYTY